VGLPSGQRTARMGFPFVGELAVVWKIEQ